MREHPVLGYSRMHKGVDFAVPPGTPIYAAGNGTIEMAGIYGGYGRYVRIRHNSDYSTAYGHMSGFGAGIHGGTRVHQGQIIGYVGSSGLATGPHLHYEVLRDGSQINPMGLKLPSGQKLARAELAKFQSARADIDRRFAGDRAQHAHRRYERRQRRRRGRRRREHGLRRADQGRGRRER